MQAEQILHIIILQPNMSWRHILTKLENLQVHMLSFSDLLHYIWNYSKINSNRIQ